MVAKSFFKNGKNFLKNSSLLSGEEQQASHHLKDDNSSQQAQNCVDDVSKDSSGKKSIKEILNDHLKNKNFESSVKSTSSFLEEMNAEMKDAESSFDSIMNIQNFLNNVYNKIITKSNKNK